jgi:hypothetical protein
MQTRWSKDMYEFDHAPSVAWYAYLEQGMEPRAGCGGTPPHASQNASSKTL